MKAMSVFTSLPSFTGPTFFGLEELHLLGQGVAKHVYELLTVSLRKGHNHAVKLLYKPTDKELKEKNLCKSEWPYTFHIAPQNLDELGKLVEKSRETIPSTFASKWENPITQSGGNRGVDWLDFFLYIVPTLFVPALTNKDARRPLLCLSKACAAALKWEITESDLRRLEK